MDKMKMLKIVEAAYTTKEMPKFNVGDTVRVMTKIYEADDKVRLHPFEGLIISKSGSGIKQNFTVRRVSYG
jgi:large subunit ribosomal protein L19